MKKSILLLSSTFLLLFMSCKTKQATTTNTAQTSESAIVYKMKKDYSKNVPVTLNENKTSVVAYPGPKDIFYKGKLAYPTALDKNYFLDNRGIGLNTAFLKLTYEEYAKLNQAPALAEMMSMLIDKDPFLEIYNLCARAQFTDEAAQLNKLITKDGLKKFTRLK